VPTGGLRRCQSRTICTHPHQHISGNTLTLYKVHLASTGLDPFCLQNSLKSLWHRFNKVLETFLGDFGPYWHDSITQLLQICRLHIHNVNLPFHHISKVLYWTEIWWLWSHLSTVNSLSCSRNQFEMIWALWHGAISCWKQHQKMVHCGHKGMDMVSNNTQVGCGISMMLRDALLQTLVVAILLWPQQVIFSHRTAAHWICSLYWTILCKP